MFSTVRARRLRRTALLSLTVAAAVTVGGCGGQDLGKANFARTTVSAQAGAGSDKAPEGPITDPAVTAAKLRAVDPCKLIAGPTLADLGTPGEPDDFGLSKCSIEVKDAGGKTIRLTIGLGESISTGPDDKTGVVEGLPRIESANGGFCYVSALTQRDPALGVQVQSSYTGGEPCQPAGVALQKVIQKLHGDPPKFEVAPGSALGVDLCTVPDDAVVKELAGADAKAAPIGLHRCTWSKTGGATLTLSFTIAMPQTASDKNPEVDLDGTKATQEASKTSSNCKLEWVHRKVDDKKSELVTFAYENYSAQASTDDPCGKAAKGAKSVLKKLPKT
ncbi:DUF3558 domain-containing protein [Amycolatopsis sp. CA-230715]|uniref:DUF3558 domain-containing protein n=1 Tax=Amycolatopsis sp. CA-230715 TaxID=2745196 RepID=UPI001C02E8C0|nr:DUF3558 domain-containing protein [Amycolatopsis sp. CA-230715]QWF82564.1 hypothetical protein HUW46_06002 [Amycolatopsis sp. CA-230715]